MILAHEPSLLAPVVVGLALFALGAWLGALADARHFDRRTRLYDSWLKAVVAGLRRKEGDR